MSDETVTPTSTSSPTTNTGFFPSTNQTQPETFATFKFTTFGIKTMKKTDAMQLFFVLIQNEAKKYPKINVKIFHTAICAIKNIQKQAYGETPYILKDSEIQSIDLNLYLSLTKEGTSGRELLMNICRDRRFFSKFTNEADILMKNIEKLISSNVQTLQNKNVNLVIKSYNNHIKSIHSSDYSNIYDRETKTIAYNFPLHLALGDSVSDHLENLNNGSVCDLTEYNNEFQKLTGFTPEDYAKNFPCFIIFNPLLPPYAKDIYTYMTPKDEVFDLKKEFLISKIGEERSVKCGAIVFQPTPFVFNGPINAPGPIKIVFGYLIDVIGVIGLTEKSTFEYYQEMYTSIIKQAIKDDSIQHLILNSVGDGAYGYGENAEDCRLMNAKAMAGAIFNLKEAISDSKLKITLLDVADKFKDIISDNICEYLKFDFVILRNKDGYLQSTTLTSRILDNERIALVNASDIRCYGGFFLTSIGDHTVEERIRNQMAPCLQYDVRYSIAPYSIKLNFVRNNKVKRYLEKTITEYTARESYSDQKQESKIRFFVSTIKQANYLLEEMIESPDNLVELDDTLRLCNDLKKLINDEFEIKESDAELLISLNTLKGSLDAFIANVEKIYTK